MMSTSLSERFVRGSAIVINASPIYYKELNSIVYAADKLIIVQNVSTGRTQKLSAHKDTVTSLESDQTQLTLLRSAGLDGRLIEWDLRTGLKLKQANLKSPIYNMSNSFFGIETKNGYSLCKYAQSEDKLETIHTFPSSFQFSVGAEANAIVAYVQNTDLYIYWNLYAVSMRYPMPHSERHIKLKQLTCVAVHPNEFVVATGNRLGEIFVWYDLTSSTPDSMDPVEDAMETDEPEEEDEESSDRIRSALIQFQKINTSIDYYPVHVSRVKRNLVHWHCTRVVSLDFTPTGSHLLSGGLEGVLVKWDMTECMGGVQQRRFLPRLGAPVSRITSPGGPSEDVIVITLQMNAFMVLSGALHPLYLHQGFIQFPRCWPNEQPLPQYMFSVESTKATDNVSSSSLLLTSASMGSLQLVSVGHGCAVTKIDVTRQSLVPRNAQSKIPISYSEVDLVALCLPWMATYERSKQFDPGQSDDASRVVWWKFDPTHSPKDLFTATCSTPLSHIYCAASDLGFVTMEDRIASYVLFADLRLLILRYEKPSLSCSKDKWTKHMCHNLTDCELPSPVHATVIPDSAGPLFCMSSPMSNFLALYRWKQLMDSAFPEQIHKVELSSLLSREKAKFKQVCLSCKPAVLHSSPEDSLLVLPLVCRVKTPDELKRSTRLCLGRFSCDGSGKLSLIHCTRLNSSIVCMAVHSKHPLLAVGLRNGSVALFKVNCHTHSPKVDLTQVHLSPPLPAHPACDRQAFHRAGSGKRKKTSKVTTRLVSLVFLDDTDEFRLAGLLETISGREKGRRDIVTYGIRSPQPSEEIQPTSKSSVLLSCTPTESAKPLSRKRPLDHSDPQFEDALRQVSQYPIHTAPPPEQLLHQLLDQSD